MLCFALHFARVGLKNVSSHRAYRYARRSTSSNCNLILLKLSKNIFTATTCENSGIAPDPLGALAA